MRTETQRVTADTLRLGQVSLGCADRQLCFDSGATIGLTPTEVRLIEALMERPGEYVPTETLLRRVWEFPEGTGGAEIVRAHVSNIRRKLRSHGQDPQILHSIPYRGYAFAVETR